MDCYDHYDSPMGRLFLRGCDTALTGLSFAPYPDQTLETSALLESVKSWLDDYFAGMDRHPDFLIDLQGSDFQKLIWRMLLDIPFGQTRTYGEIAADAAKQLGRERMSSQAVGQAVGRNPVAIIIPCHRVIGAGNRLTGYAYGLERKIWLLKHEQRERRG